MISMLIIQSIWDCRFKHIPIIVTIIGAIGGICLSIFRNRAPVSLCMALLPGLLCLLIGWMTKEAIGYGDGFLLCAMGTYLSCEDVLAIIMSASTLAGVIGLALLCFGKRKGKDQIPFVPFLLIATVAYLTIGGGKG